MYSRLKTLILVSMAAVALSGILMSAGCKGAGSNLGKDVLATVDGEPITLADLKAVNGGEIPSDLNTRKTLLSNMINNKLAAKAAIKEGYMKDPSIAGEIEAFYNDRLPDLLLKKISDETKVTDEEVMAVKSKQEMKPVIGVSVLIAPTFEDAEAAMTDIKKGADFKKAISKHSAMKNEPDTEINLAEGLYPTGVRAMLNRLKPGELSPITKMEMGYAIFRLNYRKNPDEAWKAEEPRVREAIRKTKIEAERARLLDSLRSSAQLKLETRTLPGGEVQYLGAVVNGVQVMLDPRFFGKAADPHFAHMGMNPKTLRDALNSRINKVLLSQEARRQGLDKDPDFRKALEFETEEILNAAILEKVKGSYSPTDKDLHDYYEKNKNRFAEKPGARVSRILLSSKADADAVLKELKAGKDFAALARAKSTDPSTRTRGGDAGFVDLEFLKEPLKGAISRLKTGEVSGVLKTEYGYELLKVTERVEGGPLPFTTISTTLRKRVALNKLSERVEAFYDDLHKKSTVKINDQLLTAAK